MLARHKRWTAAKLRDLASHTMHAWKKVQLGPHVSATFADAAKLLGKR